MRFHVCVKEGTLAVCGSLVVVRNALGEVDVSKPAGHVVFSSHGRCKM